MTKFEEEFNYLIELSGKVLIGQVDAEAFEKNRIAFFEKYETVQQQALPVVPECVAKTVELLKKNPESSWSKLCDSLGEEGVTWLNEFQHNDERFGFGGLNSKLIVLFHLAINGYTVEKPQLFEVKMPIIYWDDDASQLTTGFEFLRIDKETDEVDFVGFLSNTKKHTVHFTEQEIKSIDERYWQFAVPVEDGE